ncbi:MAG TPA: SIS domain-containing protein [Candidatus Limnocylindrales bacterium]
MRKRRPSVRAEGRRGATGRLSGRHLSGRHLSGESIKETITVGMRDEILEQPDVARRLLADGRAEVDAIARALAGRAIDGVVIAARGTSDHAALYAKYLFGIRNRLPVAEAAPSIVSAYGVVPVLERMLVIGISQSGASPDVAGFIAAARDAGAPTIAITNVPESALGRAAEHVVDLRAGDERALAATKTYTAELLALGLLSVALGGLGGAELDTVPHALEAVIAEEPGVERLAHEKHELDRCIILGRGYQYATAREWALKLKETALIQAEPYSAPDFEHGPRAIVRTGFPIIAIAPSGAVLPTVRSLVQRLRDEQGAEVMVVSDDPAVRAMGVAGLALPAGVPEWLSPIVAVVPGQFLAYHLTRAKGLDPEAPPHLQKVTLTR